MPGLTVTERTTGATGSPPRINRAAERNPGPPPGRCSTGWPGRPTLRPWPRSGLAEAYAELEAIKADEAAAGPAQEAGSTPDGRHAPRAADRRGRRLLPRPLRR